jgi:hypothetical protein
MPMWQNFDWPDALAIERHFEQVPFWEKPREVLCPIDQTFTVRSYYAHLSEVKAACYRWCPACHRFVGQTIMVPPARFADVLAERSGAQAMLDRLDSMWTNGTLPQEL